MQPMKIYKMYVKSVSTSSVNIALDVNDIAAGNATASNYNIVVHNTGSNWVYLEPGIGSAATAVYPADGDTKLGTFIPPGAEVTWSLPNLTTHISMIASAGPNVVGVSIGAGV